ncbi:Hypothetical protein SMAX5B_000543 [Scophthalmus maximus]|uniref:Uncharacterized protein n=1 Tax=Scophthalmus maximus TaxID=52904 RepID=A0A2U9C0K7_SCOMX|nr:Hypothetical protein SMAX5B_000543 [Scophthalmus maximus]
MSCGHEQQIVVAIINNIITSISYGCIEDTITVCPADGGNEAAHSLCQTERKKKITNQRSSTTEPSVTMSA